MVTNFRSKKTEPLAILLVFIEVVSWLWSLNGVEVIEDGKNGFFYPPFLPCE